MEEPGTLYRYTYHPAQAYKERERKAQKERASMAPFLRVSVCPRRVKRVLQGWREHLYARAWKRGQKRGEGEGLDPPSKL